VPSRARKVPQITVTSVGAPDPSLLPEEFFQLISDRALGIERPYYPPPPLSGRRCCLYRFFNTDGELLYVGVSVNLGARKSTHKILSPWFCEVASEKVEWFATRSEALAAESAAIKAENPRHNVTGKPNRSDALQAPPESEH